MIFHSFLYVYQRVMECLPPTGAGGNAGPPTVLHLPRKNRCLGLSHHGLEKSNSAIWKKISHDYRGWLGLPDISTGWYFFHGFMKPPKTVNDTYIYIYIHIRRFLFWENYRTKWGNLKIAVFEQPDGNQCICDFLPDIIPFPVQHQAADVFPKHQPVRRLIALQLQRPGMASGNGVKCTTSIQHPPLIVYRYMYI